MYRIIANLGLVLIMAASVASCGLSDDTQDRSTEEARLVQSFSAESSELQQHIKQIVTMVQVRNYREAMNKLALLSATRRLTHEQKVAVDFMVRQLRYDMEEEIFSNQESDKARAESPKSPEE